jgi:anti-sigma factor RsiW
MRDCANGELRDQLPDWVHGRLDAARAAEVEAHVASCADCASEVALLREVQAMTRRTAPAVDVARIVAALPKPPVRRRAERRWFERTQVRAAAALLLMVGATTVAWLGRPVPEDAPAVATMEFGGGMGDLSDKDLQSLLKDMDKLEATPVGDVEGGAAVTLDLGVAP